VVLLAACGGSGAKKVGGALPSCASAAHPVARPAPLADFPLPHGAVLDRTRKQAGGTILEGLVPGELKATRDWFERELPKAGYTLGAGDAEDAEAETDFRGKGADGHLKLHTIDGCKGALTVAVALRGG
jgi:hypothetical protein